MSLLVEFGPFGLFTSSRDIIVANIQSIWQPVNGNERNWLIMSVFSQDMEPSTTGQPHTFSFVYVVWEINNKYTVSAASSSDVSLLVFWYKLW